MRFSSAPSGKSVGVLRPANIIILWYAVLFVWVFAGNNAMLMPDPHGRIFAPARILTIRNPLRKGGTPAVRFTSDIWDARREWQKRKRAR